jgi:hypothetical protein
MTIWAASLLTSRIMFMSSVLVSSAIRWGATTWVGSEASQSGVSTVVDPPGPDDPDKGSREQASASAAPSGTRTARHRRRV